MLIKAIKTRIFRENEDLISFILKYVKNIKENSVLVVTSKIVALSEGRTAPMDDANSKIKLIKKESSFAVDIKGVWLTVKDDLIAAYAGIDESNGNGKFVLLPRDSFISAETIRKEVIKKFKLKNFGVIITDSRLLPGRAGVVGIAVGYSGFHGIRSYLGKKDIFGRTFHLSRTDVADCLATSAVLCMGEGREQQPLALITEAPINFAAKINKRELYIDLDKDFFKPFFKKISKKSK